MIALCGYYLLTINDTLDSIVVAILVDELNAVDAAPIPLPPQLVSQRQGV